jgi:peptidoglycan-associated lipoprotein
LKPFCGLFGVVAMNSLKILLPIFAIAFAVGCSSVDSISDSADVADSEGSAGSVIPDDSNASTYGVGSVAVAGDGGPMTDTGLLLDNRAIYFDSDAVQISPESLEILEQHGEFLSLHPQSTLRIEGHADERGSREYNLGLGERRAQAVRSVLLVQGASAAQLTTVSYGEERPAVFGSEESAWSMNRRVELVYGK